MERLFKAIRAFFAILGGTEFKEARKTNESPGACQKTERMPAPAAKDEAVQFEAGAVYALLLLQREGRLVDFLMEDLSSCSDGQIGAAARQIHDNCATVLRERFGMIPVVQGQEGAPCELGASFDPCEFKLTGAVPEGGAPFKGTLLHKGWKAAAIDLPKRGGAFKREVVCPAEVGF